MYGTVPSGPIVPAIHCAAPIESAVLLALDIFAIFVRDELSATARSMMVDSSANAAPQVAAAMVYGVWQSSALLA
jgi:hypothetical protein